MVKMGTKSDAGKGDAPRPLSISREQYEKNYMKIFGEPMKDLMLDIETLGNKPDAVIVQIGACYFDRYTGEIGDTFSINIRPQDCINQGFTVDGDTIKWWMEQAEHSWTIGGLDLRPALERFKQFAKDAKYVWSHATFDVPILTNAYKKLIIGMPFHYRAARDLRTLVDLANIEYTPSAERECQHDALGDCKYQVEYAVRCINKLKGETND